ncbi:hypothetical protein R69888_03655 [Paraburkholderia haematera]|jgi:hypothetical protein|uniref:Uncharacterized protein n=1 Tax=Paraburkholderia haematera TaxID=2793077 RepID=A0ABM8RQP5_9BURK|nr:hypothetical protein R69888_03655 [Paraburkholderia haematera]
MEQDFATNIAKPMAFLAEVFSFASHSLNILRAPFCDRSKMCGLDAQQSNLHDIN